MGNLTSLLNKIQPAIYDEISETENRNSSNPEFLEKVATINVKRTLHTIMERSPVLKEMIDAGDIGVIGGKHDIATGVVTFFDDTLIINNPK